LLHGHDRIIPDPTTDCRRKKRKGEETEKKRRSLRRRREGLELVGVSGGGRREEAEARQ
jgi:hypothetical protein